MKIKNTERALTLIELMIVIAIVAILASVANAAYSFYVIQAKNSEVTQMFGSIAHGEIKFFTTPRQFQGNTLNPCFLAALRTPLQAVGIAKVAWPSPSSAPASPIFSTLDISSSSPVYYSYQVSAVGNNVATPGFCVNPTLQSVIAVPNSDIAIISAIGDLNGDGRLDVLGSLSTPAYAAAACSDTNAGTPGVFNPPCGTFVSMFVMNLSVDGSRLPRKGQLQVATSVP